jgi:SPP1 family predicted phage head-tail adaptor
MSGAGRMDRRLVIQRATTSRNDLNEPIESWANLATVYANRRDASAGEAYKAQEVGAELTCRFTVRYSSVLAAVTPTDRILYAGRLYNITGLRETKRNRWIEIDAVARADEPMMGESSP